MLTTTVLSTLLLAATSVSAVAVPAQSPSIDEMKRSIMDKIVKRSKLNKRQSVTTGASDAVVLNFALTLEHLEAAFYGEALSKYTAADFEDAGFSGIYPLIEQVSADESQHVSFLTSALSAAGATPVEACTYSFPDTDAKSFLAVSQILESVGVSAYLGAAGSINNTAYLTAAGSILTVEARHQSIFAFLNGYSPFPNPEDTPLSAAAVVTLATPFFASCPTGSAPAIAGHAALEVTTTAPAVGAKLSIAPSNATVASGLPSTVYCGFASGLTAGFSTWTNGSCTIPTANVTDGTVFAFLTSGPSVSDATVLAGPAAIILGADNYTISLKAATNSTGGSGSGMGGGSGSGTGTSGSPSGTSAGGAAGASPTSGGVVEKASVGLMVIAGAVALFVRRRGFELRLTLEHLEAAFYGEALSKYSAADFENAGFSGIYPLIEQVSADESQHVSFLTSALSAAGATPVEACKYSFPDTDAKSFLAVSQILESVGVSAGRARE